MGKGSGEETGFGTGFRTNVGGRGLVVQVGD